MTTTDLAAPPQTRPPHISPRWWYRATWHARQAAINAHNQQQRAKVEAERQRINQLRANVEAARAEHEALYRPTAPTTEQPVTKRLDDATLVKAVEDALDRTDDVKLICDELGKTAGSLDMRMRRAGRKDLAKIFAYVRNAARYKPCRDCGKSIDHKATRCRQCAPHARTQVAA